jgi:hypothetical protein
MEDINALSNDVLIIEVTGCKLASNAGSFQAGVLELMATKPLIELTVSTCKLYSEQLRPILKMATLTRLNLSSISYLLYQAMCVFAESNKYSSVN